MDFPKCKLRHVHDSSCFDGSSSFIQQDSSRLCLPKSKLGHVHGSSCFNMTLCIEQDSFTEDLNKLDLPRCGLRHVHSSFCFDSLHESDLECNTYMFNESHQVHEASIWNDSHQFHNVSIWNDSHQLQETPCSVNRALKRVFDQTNRQFENKNHHNGDEDIYGPRDISNWADVEEYGSRGT